MSRTADQMKKLRDAAGHIITVQDELDDEETTANGDGPVRVGGHNTRGVVVDRNSGKGKVVVTGQGLSPQIIKTGPEEAGVQFLEICIQDGQTCVIYGSSTVLYYKLRQ